MAPITIVAVLALFCGRVAAHPHMIKASGNGTNDLWLAPAVCSDHPSAALGTAHPVLVANSPQLTFAVKSKGEVVTKLCPGLKYKVTVDFGDPGTDAPFGYCALVTASLGQLSRSEKECPNKSVVTKVKKPKVLRYKAPCNSTAYSVQFKATGSTGPGMQLIQNQQTLQADPTCASKKCSKA
ncbi:hypothetical protein Rsub_09467 [Raphidocelis subcapitata]|uniref:MD-2-related lipid-recognition domain-containing protein n=1 Tax=Raphidocelis subcapitata TaxID=307507 RepID=A0A2V0PI19_9CHLO|nr:hypothetical protein Rsub_09467 [Raphidocelis subcapitata]|eukprot:GBF96725.1 hypothetical protein Rsub_09467 [Raphidocelis subcapitata]